MLDAFIIEQLKEREERARRQSERENRLELPLRYDEPRREHNRRRDDEERQEPGVERGVVVIDLKDEKNEKD